MDKPLAWVSIKIKTFKNLFYSQKNSLETLEHNECYGPSANMLISTLWRPFFFCKGTVALTLTDIRLAVSLIMSSTASILTGRCVWSYWVFTGRARLKNTGSMKLSTHYRNPITQKKKKKIRKKTMILIYKTRLKFIKASYQRRLCIRGRWLLRVVSVWQLPNWPITDWRGLLGFSVDSSTSRFVVFKLDTNTHHGHIAFGLGMKSRWTGLTHSTKQRNLEN